MLSKKIIAIMASLNGEAPNPELWEQFLKTVLSLGYDLIPIMEDCSLIKRGLKQNYIYQHPDLRRLACKYGKPDFIFIEKAAIIDNSENAEQLSISYIANDLNCNIHVISDWEEAAKILQEAEAETETIGG